LIKRTATLIEIAAHEPWLTPLQRSMVRH